MATAVTKHVWLFIFTSMVPLKNRRWNEWISADDKEAGQKRGVKIFEAFDLGSKKRSWHWGIEDQIQWKWKASMKWKTKRLDWCRSDLFTLCIFIISTSVPPYVIPIQRLLYGFLRPPSFSSAFFHCRASYWRRPYYRVRWKRGTFLGTVCVCVTSCCGFATVGTGRTSLNTQILHRVDVATADTFVVMATTKKETSENRLYTQFLFFFSFFFLHPKGAGGKSMVVSQRSRIMSRRLYWWELYR